MLKFLQIPLLLVSWTGWTKEDYISFFKKFSPWNLGWTKEEWKINIINILMLVGFIFLLILMEFVEVTL